MEFLIQTINNEIIHDFSFHLIQSIKYNNWFRGKEIMSYKLSETILEGNYIPIGSVEFVQEFLGKKIIPKNIPKELQIFEYLKRNIYIGNEKDVFNIKTKMFVKSNTQIKSFTDIVYPNTVVPNDEYLISDIINIDSEYRCFVFKNKLLDIRNYCGDFKIFPNIDTINNIIKNYKNAPIAYTLDIGVNDKDTFIIEIHDFFSCGLYGFENYTLLPYMFDNWMFEFNKNEYNKEI